MFFVGFLIIFVSVNMDVSLIWCPDPKQLKNSIDKQDVLLLFDSKRVSCLLYSLLGIIMLFVLITLFVLINDFGVGVLW